MSPRAAMPALQARWARTAGHWPSVPLPPAARRWLQRLAEATRRHPRRVTAGALVCLGGFAATAFGVAPLVDPQQPPALREVVEPLALPGLEAQLEALADHTPELLRHDTTRAGDTADALLRRLGVSDAAAARFLRSDRDARRLLDGEGGKSVQVRTAPDGSLRELVARMSASETALRASHFLRLSVVAEGEGRFATRLQTVPYTVQARMASGTVRGTIWAAADEARLPESVADQLVDIFSGDIDFHRQLKRGDSFRVVYEALSADELPVTWGDGAGRILAAEFTSRGRSHRALWFPGGSGTGSGGYFSFDGRSRKQAFLASPLPFSRMTSGFAERLHPVLNSWRQHHGVDYAAPSGTPVFSVGDGVVEFAGRQRGYGNVVELRHDGRRTTLYAHLSAIDVQEGQRVSQGQAIGRVGATGWATGPHLHFEFRVDGAFQDPLTVASSSADVSLDAGTRQRFQQRVAMARQQIDAAQWLAGRGEAE